MEHRGYEGTVEFSKADNVLYGEIIGIVDVIGYDGISIKELEENFIEAVDDYLEFCKEEGKDPDKPYKGSFSIRMAAPIHRQASIAAKKMGISLNRFMEVATKNALKEEDNLFSLDYGMRFNQVQQLHEETLQLNREILAQSRYFKGIGEPAKKISKNIAYATKETLPEVAKKSKRSAK